MAYNAPGKHYRKGLSDKEFFKLFPDDDTAEAWFIANRWPEGIRCPRCGSDNVQLDAKHKTMDYRCRKSRKKGGCGRFFSTKTGTFMEASNIGYQDWLYALYLVTTNLKSVSSMKLRRNLDFTQKTTWHMAHRIRKALGSYDDDSLFHGPVEADETYVGGRRANMPKAKRKELDGRGPIGKTAVVGIKDRITKSVRAKVVSNTDSRTLQGFVRDSVEAGATVYTDDALAYDGLVDYDHESVKHSVAEYVRGNVHTNGIESFWSLFKRAHKGTFHKISPKHLQRYVTEFVGRHNMRELDTLDQMRLIVLGMEGTRLRYEDLIS